MSNDKDARRAAAVRAVGDEEVARAVKRLKEVSTDFAYDEESVELAIDLLTRLSAAKEEAGRERDALRLEAVELAASLESEERKHENTVKQRDEAEEAVSDTYFAVMGEAPEWSNRFGYPQALEDIKGAHKLLGDAVRSARADALEEAAKVFDAIPDETELSPEHWQTDPDSGVRVKFGKTTKRAALRPSSVAARIRALKPVQGEQ